MFYLQFSRPLKTLCNHQISHSHVSPSLMLHGLAKFRRLLHQVNILTMREKERDLLNYLTTDEKKNPICHAPFVRM